MAQPIDYVEYLSREVGARPAGTEEEQQAALYIADAFQEEAGFAASIEEFTSSSNLEGGRAILCMVTIVVSILAMLFNVLTAPALILAIISAVIFVLEVYDKPVLSRLLSRGASQNVVAKYQPSGGEGVEKRGNRKRKIVLVAHYDTGKVTPGIVKRVEGMGLPLGMVCLGAMIAAAFFLLMRVFVGATGGVGLIFVNILTIIAIIILALPILKAILYRTAPYNEGANNNATGTAALIEIAKRISSGSSSEAELAAHEGGVVMHGEEAIRESGLVPEGAEFHYDYALENEDEDEEEPRSEEERLLAAKAAIAALTGRSIEPLVYAPVSHELPGEPPEECEATQTYDQVQSEWVEERFAQAEIPPAVVSPSAAYVQAAEPRDHIQGFENAPSWFVAAQKNAKRSESSEPIQRSRYTEAIQAAEREIAERDRLRAEEEQRARDEATRAAMAALRPQAAPAPASESESVQQQITAFDEVSASAVDTASVEAAVPMTDTRVDEIPDGGVSFGVSATAWDEAAPVVEVVSDAGLAMPAPAAEFAIDGGIAGEAMQVMPAADDQLIESSVFEAMAKPVPGEDALSAHGEGVAVTFDHADVATPDEATVIGEAPVEVDLGQTISYEPEALSAALREELASEAAGGVRLDKPVTKTRRSSEALDKIAEMELSDSVPSTEAHQVKRSRLVGLPSIEQAPAAPTVPETTNPSRSGLFRMLRTDVPSLSGETPSVASKPTGEASSQTAAIDYGARDAQAATSAQPTAPDVSETVPMSEASAASESVQQGFDDYDDYQYGQMDQDLLDAEDGGDFAAPNQMDMPKTRSGGFFSRLRRKNKGSLADTPQEWLDVDEDFEAREVGRKRGSWESFREEDNSEQGRKWEGGALSRLRLGHVSTRSGEGEEADMPEELVEAQEDILLNEEIEQIYHFRNPDYPADIWFVAIGSDTELHDGAKAFIDEHKSELRGAVVIEIESLGAGYLAAASEEGQFRKMQASSRIKRFTRGAAEKTGIVLDQVKTTTDSITTTFQKSGMQAMHLMGVEDGLCALKGSADDILENVDELVLEENINYLMELLKQE